MSITYNTQRNANFLCYILIFWSIFVFLLDSQPESAELPRECVCGYVRREYVCGYVRAASWVCMRLFASRVRMRLCASCLVSVYAVMCVGLHSVMMEPAFVHHKQYLLFVRLPHSLCLWLLWRKVYVTKFACQTISFRIACNFVNIIGRFEWI